MGGAVWDTARRVRDQLAQLSNLPPGTPVADATQRAGVPEMSAEGRFTLPGDKPFEADGGLTPFAIRTFGAVFVGVDPELGLLRLARRTNALSGMAAQHPELRDEVAPLGIRVIIVEPGAFRTEFAGGGNLRPERRLDAYRPVVDLIEAYLYGSDGKQPGNPRKAALARIAAVDSSDPPLRLMLGADAFRVWEKKRTTMKAEFACWRERGEATAFKGATVAPVGG